MNMIGCDLHTRYQVVAWIEEETGEIRTRRLEHGKEEVRGFYGRWPRGACVGIEATLPALWFERLIRECGHELWVGDAAEIWARSVRRQVTDTRSAEHLLDLLLTKRFPRSSGNLCVNGGPLGEGMKAPTILHGLRNIN